MRNKSTTAFRLWEKFCNKYWISNFMISKSLFVNERPVSVLYIGLVVLGSSPETCMVSTECVLLSCSSAGCSLRYWQRRRPIGCSAQVQPSHWSKVEQEGSNHRPLFSFRTEAGKEEGDNTPPLTSLQHFHEPMPHTQTHTQRQKMQMESWISFSISPIKREVLKGNVQIALS